MIGLYSRIDENVNDGFPENYKFLGRGKEQTAYLNPDDGYVYKITNSDSIDTPEQLFEQIMKIEITRKLPYNMNVDVEIIGYYIDYKGKFRLITKQEYITPWKNTEEYLMYLDYLQQEKGWIINKSSLIIPEDNFILRDIRQCNCGLKNGIFKVFDVYYSTGYISNEEIKNILKYQKDW